MGGTRPGNKPSEGELQPQRAGDPGIAPSQPTQPTFMQGSPTVEPGRHVAGPGGAPA